MKKYIKKTLLLFILVMLVLGSVLYFYRVRLLKHYSPTVHKVGNMKMSIINDTTFVLFLIVLIVLKKIFRIKEKFNLEMQT